MERIAHRGAKRECPENTLPAFARAYARGADAVELDVHATADGVVVVHHDHWIGGNRVTAPQIAELEWAQLRTMEVGAKAGEQASVPTLEQALDETPGHATVYVEIKGRGIEQRVVDVIRRSSARCAVHSFDHDAIARVRQLAPELPRGVLFEDRATDILAALRLTDARDVWPRCDLIDAALVERVHRARGRVIAWTVNSLAEAQRLIALGVDGLCGDDVRLFPSS